MFNEHDISRNACQLFGEQASQGYDWWWHSFTARNAATGEENKEKGVKPSYLILHENGQKIKLTPRSIVSIATYSLATVLGGFCPTAAFIIAAVVSAWWIIPDRR